MKGIRFENVEKGYPGRKLFSSLSFEVPSSGFYALCGHSGSGKTTVLDLLTGLERPDGGSIYLLGRRVDGHYPDRLLDIGYLRQSHDLLLEESVLENAMLPLLAAGRSKGAAKSRAKALLARLGLRSKSKRLARDLSGGEKARLALARALALDPPVVFADEPTGALDEENALEVYSLLKAVSSSRLVFMVTHDEARSFPFLDGAYRLLDGGIQRIWEKADRFSLARPARVEKRKRSTSLFLAMARHKMRVHKFESSFFLLILSFALSSLGTASYLSTELPSAMAASFAAITGEGEIHLSSRGGDSNVKAYSPDVSRVRDLLAGLEDETAAIGVSYEASWESFFPEENEARLSFRNREWKVSGLSLRSLNEYWLLSETSAPIYPERPSVLEDSQVVLGLSFEAMNAMALAYGIGRDYRSIGEYLSQNPFELVFFFENAGWGYEAELLLEVVAVAATEKTLILHDSPLWSERIFEEALVLPSYPEPGSSGEPWSLLKSTYVLPSIDPTLYVAKARDDPRFDGCLLARASRGLNSLSFDGSGLSSLSRLYVYALSGTFLDEAKLREVVAREEIESELFLSSGSYLSFPEALASGFAYPFFLSSSLEEAFALSEAMPSYDPEAGHPIPDVPSSCAVGYYLLPRNQGLTLSSGGTLLEGQPPSTIDEIGLSKGLYEKLGRPEKVFVAGVYGIEGVGNALCKDAYGLASLTVSGVYEGNGDVAIVLPHWPIDFFRDRIGMSAFSLLPSQLILRVDPDKTASFSSFLNARYPDFRFIDPSALVSGGIEEGVSYMGAVVDVLVFFMGTMALLLTVAVALSGAERSRKEGRSLFILGFGKDEVATRDFLSLALPLFYAVPLAFLSLSFLEYAVYSALASSFGSAAPFQLEARPFILVLAYAGTALFLMGLAFFFKGRTRDYSRNGK